MYTSVYPGFQTNPTNVKSSKLIINTEVYTTLYMDQSHIRQTKILPSTTEDQLPNHIFV